MIGATKERETENVKAQNGNGQKEAASNTSLAANKGVSQDTTPVEHTGKQEATTQEGVERTRAGKIFLPAVDIYETSDGIVLVADMPGVDEKSVEVSLEKSVLTIYGRVEPQLPAGHSLTYSEYALGDYHRSFTISNDIDWERIEGTVKNGVLRLTLPKAGPAKTTKINIKPA